MRQLKGARKATSLYRREACLKHFHVVFQKAYLAAKGEPQEKFEEACRATDTEIFKCSSSEPQKKAFWILVTEDFKNHLLNLANNEDMIEAALEKEESRESELVKI